MNYQIYKGPNFYSKFTHFIGETIEFLKMDARENNTLLTPKFYINKALVSRIKDLSTFKFEAYTLKTDNYPLIVGEIKSIIKNYLSNEDNPRILKLVDIINNHFSREISIRKSLKNPVNSLSKICNRMYSTSTNKDKANAQRIKKDRDISR